MVVKVLLDKGGLATCTLEWADGRLERALELVLAKLHSSDSPLSTVVRAFHGVVRAD